MRATAPAPELSNPEHISSRLAVVSHSCDHRIGLGGQNYKNRPFRPCSHHPNQAKYRRSTQNRPKFHPNHAQLGSLDVCRHSQHKEFHDRQAGCRDTAHSLRRHCGDIVAHCRSETAIKTNKSTNKINTNFIQNSLKSTQINRFCNNCQKN